MSANAAIYKTLSKGPATEAEIRKGSKLDEGELTAALDDWKARLWVQVDESGKSPKFEMTEEGRLHMANRYPDA